MVLPHRDSFELGRGQAVLRRASDRIAASQAAALRGVVTDWMAGETGATCGEWWGGAGADVVDVVSVDGPHVLRAASCHWAAGVEGSVWRDRLRKEMSTRAEAIDVVARTGTGVITPSRICTTASG